MEVKNEDSELIVNADEDQDEATPLFIITEKTELNDHILVRTVSFGLHHLFLAAHIAANSKLLAMLGPEGVGAGALVSTYYSLIVSGTTGILLSSGLEMGPHIGRRNFRRAGEVAKSAWVLTIGVGVIATGLLISTRGIFPLLFDQKVAETAADFFSSYITTVPLLLLTTSSQIAFQAGDWFIPPLTTGAFFGAATLFSYLLAFKGNFGAFGIGFGGSIASIGVLAALQTWFIREKYRKFHLYKDKIHHLKDNLLKLLGSGWKLSLQRVSEWGNLVLITTILGMVNEKSLTASNPSNVYIILIATAFQGLAQGSGMLIARNRAAMFKAIEKNENYDALDFYKKNRSILVQNIIFSALLNLSFAGACYFAGDQLTNYFLSPDADNSVKELSKTLLWINILGLSADGIRITSSGVLRGWQDILYPTLVSLIIMIGVGIPAGYGLGELFGDEAQFMFFLRDLSVAISGGIILHRFAKKITQDAEHLQLKEPSCNNTLFRFFKTTNHLVKSESDSDSQSKMFRNSESLNN